MGDHLTYVGHATVLAEVDGVRLLTDPVLRSRVGHLRRQQPAPGAAAVERLDAILVSHLHHDHADVPSLRRLDRRLPVLGPPGSAAFFARLGFDEVAELAPGEAAAVGGVRVTATPALHPSRKRLERASEAIGFLIEGGGRRVYFAGDTDLFDAMADLADGLDAALLPVWGWGPTLGPGHLDPQRAARAAALLSPRIAIPIHWGTLYPLGLSRLRPEPLRSPPLQFAEWTARLAPQVEARVLSPGESLTFS